MACYTENHMKVGLYTLASYMSPSSRFQCTKELWKGIWRQKFNIWILGGWVSRDHSRSHQFCMHTSASAGGRKANVKNRNELLWFVEQWWDGTRRQALWCQHKHTHTHTHFAVLTNADGKTHAVTLIAYKLLWMVGHNVINLALYGWQECMREKPWWRKLNGFHKMDLDGYLHHVSYIFSVESLSI